MIRLVADILDEQLEDARGKSAGRIDGIVLQLRDDKPPLVAYLEVSPVTLLARFSIRLARWYARFDRRLGPRRGMPFRIPWSRVARDGPVLKMDLVLSATPIDALDDWLATHVVDRIPGMR